MTNLKDYEEKNLHDVVEMCTPPMVLYLLIYSTQELLVKETSLEVLYEHEDLIDNTAIIIEEDLDIIFKCQHCEMDHHHDCVIFFPHNKQKFYTSKNNLKLVKP